MCSPSLGEHFLLASTAEGSYHKIRRVVYAVFANGLVLAFSKSPLVSWPSFRCFSTCLGGTEQCRMLSHNPEQRELPQVELHIRCLRPGWTNIHPSSIPTLPQAPRVHHGGLPSSPSGPQEAGNGYQFLWDSLNQSVAHRRQRWFLLQNLYWSHTL